MDGHTMPLSVPDFPRLTLSQAKATVFPGSCTVCEGQAITRDGWRAVCPSCGFQFSNLSPGAGPSGPGLEALRRRNFRVLLDALALQRPLKGLRLLDAGSAHGWFLEEAALRGMKVHGIEPEARAAAKSRAEGFDVVSGFFPRDLPPHRTYDVITFNDVFEHLPEPSVVLHDIERLLAPGGLLVINLPSADGIIYRTAELMQSAFRMDGLLQRLWQKGFASPHLSYFTVPTLQRLVTQQTRLKVVASFPLLSVTRHGLWQRISLSHRGPVAWALFAAIYAASFFITALPADIICIIFRKHHEPCSRVSEHGEDN